MDKHLKAVTILLRASNFVQELLRKDIENYGLNTTEFGTLEYLYHKGPKPIQQICKRLLMANSSMTYVIDKLEKKGFVRRVHDQSDRRVINIELTESGRQYIERIFPEHAQRIRDIYSILNEQEMDFLMELLKKLGYHSEALVKQNLSE